MGKSGFGCKLLFVRNCFPCKWRGARRFASEYSVFCRVWSRRQCPWEDALGNAVNLGCWALFQLLQHVEYGVAWLHAWGQLTFPAPQLHDVAFQGKCFQVSLWGCCLSSTLIDHHCH